MPSSAVPSVRQRPLPICAANETRSKPPPETSAPIVTVPVEPSAGAWRASCGAASVLASLSAALNTTEESGGTVTVSFLSAPLVTVEPACGYSWLKPIPAEKVSSETVLASAELFTATTYSTCCFASIRENAYTPGPSAAYRSICAPSASAGLAFRSAASVDMPW